MNHRKLAVVIPTYKRALLLKYLITDLLMQTTLPDELIVVDGDSKSTEVNSMLMQFQFPINMVVKYIPSNHGNAPYQRFLGVESIGDCEWVIFIDDDIRLIQNDSIEKLTAPFTWNDRFIVGITPRIVFPSRNLSAGVLPKWRILRFMGSSFGIAPGGLTPSGDRIMPTNTGNDYEIVQWLCGGVMSYRKSGLRKVVFSEDVFALSEIRCGLGADDTYLSRCVGLGGELLYAHCVSVQHPDSDSSKAYPADMRQLAYARAYSRRFLNDHYRLREKPLLSDRIALLKSYLWNIIINWGWLLIDLRAARFMYAWGYMMGALRGLIQSPRARTLTPRINWIDDSKESIQHLEIISGISYAK